MKRYYCPQPELGRLDEAESHHCIHVMRQEVGDYFTVFDGRGLELKARVSDLSGDRVHFEKVAENRTRAPRDSICLAQAITKGKSMELIIQKATELGVTEIIPLQSDRTVAQVGEEKAGTRREKWRQLTIEAAKQCGQNWLPTFLPPQKPRDFLAAPTGRAIKLIASLQPEAQPLKKVLREALAAHPPPHRLIIMIGPEGDFTPAEIGEARSHGFLPVSLGSIILRSETAALFTLGAVVYELTE